MGVSSLKSRVSARKKNRRVLISEINVTPFIDVMLVLLVIFMVTAPLLSVGVDVDLPQTDAQPLHAQQEPLIVTIRADKTIFLQKTVVSEKNLAAKIVALSGGNPNISIYIRGDRKLRYALVLRIMGQINRAGFTKVSLVADKLR